MLRPEKMKKIRIVGLYDRIESVIAKLHELGCMQIEDLSKYLNRYSGLIELDKPLENFRPISEQLVKLRAIESLLIPHDAAEEQLALGFRDAIEKASQLTSDTTINLLHEELSNIEERKWELMQLKNAALMMHEMNIDTSLLRDKFLSFFVGKIPARAYATLEDEVKKLSDNYELCASRVGKNELLIILAIDKEVEDEATRALNNLAFSSLDISQLHGKPAEALLKFEQELRSLATRRNAVEEKIAHLSRKSWYAVASLREMLEIASQQAEITIKFGKTKNLFIIEGWVADKNLPLIKKSLAEVTGNTALVEVLKTTELPPTLLNNPPILKPYEDFITFISMPKSNEFDPTALFALMFPIIYGMMLGDIGYGFLVLLIALFGLKKSKGIIRSICYALIPAALSSMAFGFAFGEILGFEFPSILNRVENITSLLGIALVTGAVHIGLGLVLGLVKEIEHRKLKHACGKLGWLLLEIGGALLFLMMFANFKETTIALALVGLSIVLILIGEGAIGLIEIPRLLGNIFSYARIAAVGLASLALALVINTFKPDFAHIDIFFFLALLVFIMGHTLNVGLALFEPFVQATRLHYVEFFTKFYDGGGTPFLPFREIRRLTAK